MIKAIQDYCQNSNQPIPKTAGELANVIYQSLAISYAATIEEIEMLNKKKNIESKSNNCWWWREC